MNQKYDAFISYSRAVDGCLAPALEQGLKRYAKPWHKRRALEVFRDEASLAANPSLWGSIEAALSQSKFFVLLASPKAAQSEWVKKEVTWWFANRCVTELIIVLTDGEIFWDKKSCTFDLAKSNAIPEVLMNAFQDEPRWIDIRWARNNIDISLSNHQFISIIADIASPIHGIPKDELLGQEVREFRKSLLLRRLAVSLLIILSILLFQQRNHAIRSQNAAEVAEKQAKLERDSAIAARQAADSEKKKAFQTLSLAIENLSSFSNSLVDYLSKNKDIPNSVRLTTLEITEDSLWSIAQNNDLEEVRQTIFTNVLERISATYHRLGYLDKSMNTWEKVVQLQRKLVERNLNILGWKSSLAASLIRLSYHKQALGDFQGQLEDMREAVGIYQQLLNTQYQKAENSDPTLPEEQFHKILRENYDRFSLELEKLTKSQSIKPN